MKNLLLLTFFAICVSLFTAQKAEHIPTFKKYLIAEKEAVLSEEQAPYKPHVIPNRSEATSIQLGSASNIYTTILGSQNQLSYDSNTGALVFLHRQNTNDPGGNSSGTLRYDVSIDGGATWTNNLGPLTPEFEAGNLPEIGNGPRYPSVAIYNPPGNTDPNNAYLVGNGPALSTNPGSWGNIFEVSVKLDGTNLSEAYANYVPPSISGNDTTTLDFHPYGVTQAGEYIYSLSTSFNSSGDATRDTLDNYYFSLNRASFNGGTNSFDWEQVALIVEDWHRLSDNTNFISTWNIAFDPSGQTGYAVMLGGEISTMGLDTISKPVCYKTTDNGLNWAKLPEFDFATLPVMQDNVFDEGFGIRPYIADMDIVVDVDGRLHLCAEVLSGTFGSNGELNFVQTDLTTQFMAHLHTTDGTDWGGAKIDDIINEDGAVGTVAHTKRPQASVSSDGTKVFLAYTKDINSEDGPIINPDVYCVAWDQITGNYTGIKSLTADTDGEEVAYYANLAPFSISNGTSQDYEVVFEYGLPTGDDLSVIDFFYVMGAGFDNGEFVGIEENELTNAINIFPNPASSDITISINQLEKVNLNITDITGKTLDSFSPVFGRLEIDISDYSSGMYFFNFVKDNVRTTKKVIVK